MLLVSQLKNEPRVASAARFAPDSLQFLTAIDGAVRRLMQMAEWDSAIQEYCFTACERCIFVPPEVKRILGVQINRIPGRIFNRVFSYIPNGPGGWAPGARGLIDRGTRSLFLTETSCPSGLVVISSQCEDVGAHVRVQGLDSANQPVISSTGKPFIEFDLGLEGGQGHVYDLPSFSKITQVTKTVTRGHVFVYLLDSVLEQPADLVTHILPWQTSADYRMYEVSGIDPEEGEGIEVRLHARRGHVPLTHDDQAVMVDSVDAIVACLKMQDAIDNRDTEAASLFRAEVLNNLRELSLSENYRQERRVEFDPVMRLGGARQKMGR